MGFNVGCEMKLYLASSLCWAYPVDDVIKIAKSFNFDGVEIWAEHVWHYQTAIDSILKVTEETDLELSLHAASWDLNLCSINEGIRKQSVNEIEKSIQLGHQLSAKNITIHPGKYSLQNEFQEKAQENLIKNIAYLENQAQKLGVTLSLEQMEPIKKEFITTPHATNRLLESLPESVKVTFDIAHVPLSSSPEEYYHELKRINKVHISDSTKTHYHVAIGSGDIQLETIVKELKDTNLPVVLEGFENNFSLKLIKENMHYLNNTFHL